MVVFGLAPLLTGRASDANGVVLGHPNVARSRNSRFPFMSRGGSIANGESTL
jgi:hypothetical protein